MLIMLSVLQRWQVDRGTSRDWYSGVGSKLYPFPYNCTSGQIIGPVLSNEPTQFGSQRRLKYEHVWHPLPSLFPDVLQCQGQKYGGHIVPMKCTTKFLYISVTVLKSLKPHTWSCTYQSKAAFSQVCM